MKKYKCKKIMNKVEKYVFVKEKFETKRIDKVKLSDAKAWLIKLQKDGMGYSSIHSIRGVVRPAFQMAEIFEVKLKRKSVM